MFVAFSNELVNSDICPTTHIWSYVTIALQDTQQSYAFGDADVLIATTAASTSIRHATTVIGEDIDVLVLLCHHADTQM